MEARKVLKSGEFLVENSEAKNIFIPEEFNEEQRMIAQTCQDFLNTEVYPNADKVDKQDRDLMKSILKKSGELGLMGISIPEEYNGFGQSFVTQMLAAETIGAGYSFSVAFMAHCGIGTLPIMYYGTEEQRQKYVTRLATGEILGAYCLTEPGAGSDANAGKTNARLSEDGRYYILNGQKMWITNAGFADIQTVFAKIDNDRVLSAFIVEKDFPGVVISPDEHKMGIKGSSTAQIFYNDVKVPVENLLGKPGEGFRIALSILHMGRIKLGANVLGAAKKAINDSVKYANERKQFGVLISTFGAIKFKLAEQVIRTFAAESANYRVSKDIDDLIEKYKTEGCDKGRATIDGISHYAVEAAILKVYGSEFGRTGFQGGLQWYRCTTSGQFVADLEVFSGRTIDVPSCFIAGKSDWGPYQRPGNLERMQNQVCTQMQGCHLLEGAGHWVQQEQPEGVSRLLITFLQQRRG